MFKKIFLDANIIADIYDHNRPSVIDSRKTMLHFLDNKNVELFTSCDIITTIYYILSKQSKDIALDAIIEINELCHVVEFGNSEIIQSCSLMKKDKNYKDLEDTIQYVMAKKMSCDLILSNDKGFASKDITLLTTKAFVEKYLQG